MTFKHDCFNDREARTYRENQLSWVAPDTMFGILSYRLALAVGVIAVLQALIFWASGVSMWVVAACALVAVVTLFFGLKGKESANARRSRIREIAEELTPASNSDLAWLIEQGKAFPDVASEVRRWLPDGRTIRERDMRAVRSYVVAREPGVRRQELLATLSGE